MTAREERIARLITLGYENKQIANELKISEQTVKNHVSDILRKLDIGNRAQIAVRYIAIKSGRNVNELLGATDLINYSPFMSV
jgi:DNA-binding NarL/FixJ family response regulator